uniref:Uncharacterized protein n=1 Tax=Rhizophora mucronata TaxID=61149 RepID=A0A2P2IY79_RHIMU
MSLGVYITLGLIIFVFGSSKVSSVVGNDTSDLTCQLLLFYVGYGFHTCIKLSCLPKQHTHFY